MISVPVLAKAWKPLGHLEYYHLHQHIMHEYQPLFLSSCFTLFFFAFLGLYLFIAISTESLTIHSTAGIRYLIASSTAVLSS